MPQHDPLQVAVPVALALCLLPACEKPAPPWRGKPSASVIDPSQPFLPTRRSQKGWLRDAAGGGASAAEVRAKPRAGGLWARCYEGFQPVAEPLDAVTRLGLMCGPVNGMIQHGATRRGKLKSEPSRHRFAAKQGECFRVFAVASEGIANLDVRIVSARGTLLHKDRSHHRWPVVEATRPFCSFADDTFGIEIIGAAAGGSYALQVWKLPAPLKR